MRFHLIRKPWEWRKVLRAMRFQKARRRLDDEKLVQQWVSDGMAFRKEKYRKTALDHYDHCNCYDCTMFLLMTVGHKPVTVIDGDHTYIQYEPVDHPPKRVQWPGSFW